MHDVQLQRMGKARAQGSRGEETELWEAPKTKLMNVSLISQVLESYLSFGPGVT